MSFDWNKTALVIQGMGGFEALVAGFLKVLQEKNIYPKAITTEGSNVSVSMYYSTKSYTMDTYIETLMKENIFTTPPEMVFSGSYSNSVFHSTQAFEYMSSFLKGTYSTLYTYHYKNKKNIDQLQKAMKFPVYTSILNLLDNQAKTLNMQNFDMKKNIWLGTRIPYFKPEKIDGEIYVENLYENPPLKEILKDSGISHMVMLRLYPQVIDEPKNSLELQDRCIDLGMNSYLNRQIKMIEKVNKWVEDGFLPKKDYKNIDLYHIHITPEPLDYLDYTPIGLKGKFDKGYEEGKKFFSKYKLG